MRRHCRLAYGPSCRQVVSCPLQPWNSTRVPCCFADFAGSPLDEDAGARLDLTTLRPMPTGRIGERFERRENGSVWNGVLKDDPDRCISLYLTLEFQSAVDRHMAAHMLAHIALLYEDCSVWKNRATAANWRQSIRSSPTMGLGMEGVTGGVGIDRDRGDSARCTCAADDLRFGRGPAVPETASKAQPVGDEEVSDRSQRRIGGWHGGGAGLDHVVRGRSLTVLRSHAWRGPGCC